MTVKPKIPFWHPFKSESLSGPQVGWFRPAAAVMLGFILPTTVALAMVYIGGPDFWEPIKSDVGYSFWDHVGLITGVLSVSFIVSWMAIPFTIIALRATAMLGYAGWGTALLCAWGIGLPIVHIALNADATTDESAILTHMTIAVGILGLSVWAAFWALVFLRKKRT